MSILTIRAMTAQDHRVVRRMASRPTAGVVELDEHHPDGHRGRWGLTVFEPGPALGKGSRSSAHHVLTELQGTLVCTWLVKDLNEKRG